MKHKSLEALNEEIVRCTRCPRLVAYREKIAIEKRRAYRDWDYWGKPIPTAWEKFTGKIARDVPYLVLPAGVGAGIGWLIARSLLGALGGAAGGVAAYILSPTVQEAFGRPQLFVQKTTGQPELLKE